MGRRATVDEVGEGDVVIMRGHVTRVSGDLVTVRLAGYGIPVTVGTEDVEVITKAPRPRGRPKPETTS